MFLFFIALECSGLKITPVHANIHLKYLIRNQIKLVKFQPFERIPTLCYTTTEQHWSCSIETSRTMTQTESQTLELDAQAILLTLWASIGIQNICQLQAHLSQPLLINFGACNAAFMLNFPKHFSHFCWILKETFQQGSRIPVFFIHPVYCRAKLNINTQIKFQLCISLSRKSF